MYKLRNYLFLLFIGLGITFTACEKDGLTEEEVLDLTQKTTFAVNIREEGTNQPLAAVDVTISAGSNVYTSASDEFGVAYFENVEQGDVIIALQKEGYFDLSQEAEVFSNGRLAGDNITLRMYSEEMAAVVRGNVKIQIDLTSEAYENPAGIDIYAKYNNTVISSTKTDADGNYSLIIPTTANGRYVTIHFPDLEFDQKVAIREEGVVVSKTVKGTIFRPYDKAMALPSTANILATVANPNYSRGRQAYVESLTVEAGVITAVELGDIGYGYSINPTVYINSLDGGSGANIKVDYDYNSSYCYPEYYRLDPNEIYIYDGGAGYPDYEANINVSTMHPGGFKWNNCDYLNETERVESGDVYIIDVNYGTGTELGEIL
ncbi:hypothetical protein JMN32_07055 [Fulvivirga sp. 29W222]|uniref:Carboxypeptidase regulatory-like domain-containing protein n=1 Tax=Fulvivirga marina TaxID=2494733 RepID=A0A937KDB1_9BACT|nr:hypothetical protein [Fulvivirga marina]MBL6446058.1 hypothetical protein [Fulvivirga marina]